MVKNFSRSGMPIKDLAKIKINRDSFPDLYRLFENIEKRTKKGEKKDGTGN